MSSKNSKLVTSVLYSKSTCSSVERCGGSGIPRLQRLSSNIRFIFRFPTAMRVSFVSSPLNSQNSFQSETMFSKRVFALPAQSNPDEVHPQVPGAVHVQEAHPEPQGEQPVLQPEVPDEEPVVELSTSRCWSYLGLRVGDDL
ncbi:hypothetical protein F2Q69_00029618 [Brassica cretica]|uniref:Uncharacterized protein n=1 Tax=Brassica cretica TaxID=69181 RepID=A0A8S9S4R8_BRACR|nr:hypothetical protein F2Q69_00029618 [Brassica cretica]